MKHKWRKDSDKKNTFSDICSRKENTCSDIPSFSEVQMFSYITCTLASRRMYQLSSS